MISYFPGKLGSQAKVYLTQKTMFLLKISLRNSDFQSFKFSIK